jgi:hypothetical protein
MTPGEKLLIRAFFEYEFEEREQLLKNRVWPTLPMM